MVTRGNVAIYCYNALTAKTWDVTSSEDGKLTSSTQGTTTILEKYFSDFVNDAGDMKLVEGVVVAGTPITDSTIGTSQIIFADPEDTNGNNNMAQFLGVKSNVKNKEEKTYLNTTDDIIVAYVLESACDNIATLYGKSVDVIFGKDNKVAYIALTDDAMDGFVTAWDGEEIEIDGEVYEFADAFTVTVYSTAVGTAATDIDALFSALTIADADRSFNRSVKANVVLTEDGEIEKIDFMFAEDYEDTNNVKVENYIVKSISSKGKINAISTNSSNTNILGDEFEKIEEDVRVIKNNEISSLEDIEIGDVLTLVSKWNSNLTTPAYELATVYVASERAEGEVTRLKTDNYTLNGEDVYYTVNTVIGDSNGDIEDAEDVADLKVYYGEEVEFYLNFMGEVVAVVANTEATDSTLGIVTTTATVKTDDNDVDYLSVRILTEDGEARYKVYNKKSGENYDDATAYGETFTKEALAQGVVVIFAADADNVIKSNEIEVVDGYEVVAADATGAKKVVETVSSADTEIAKADVGNAIALGKYVVAQSEYVIGSTTVEKVTINSIAAQTGVSNSKQKVTQDSKDYKFGSAVLFNTKTDDEEVINGWSSICNDATTYTEFNAYNGIAFYKKTTSATKNVLYYVANIGTYVAEEAEYAVLVDIEYTTNDDEEDVYVATLYVDGTEVEYEVDAERVTLTGLNPTDFVTFELSDGEITSMTKLVDVYAISKLDSEEAIDDNELKYWNASAWAEKEVAHKGLLEVGTVYETYFEYVEKFEETNNTLDDLDINEDGYIIYDLREGFDMFDGDLTQVEGLYVYGFETEVGEGYDVFVILD